MYDVERKTSCHAGGKYVGYIFGRPYKRCFCFLKKHQSVQAAPAARTYNCLFIGQKSMPDTSFHGNAVKF